MGSMRHPLLTTLLSLCTSVLFSVGCGSNAPPSDNSFSRVYTEIIQPKCSNDYCHFNSVSIRYSALDMSSHARAYWSLVGLPCMGPACSQSGMRVVPGDPARSVMYQKLLPSPPCGARMPADKTQFFTNGTSELKFSGTPLPDDQQRLIHDWILEGAYNN